MVNSAAHCYTRETGRGWVKVESLYPPDAGPMWLRRPMEGSVGPSEGTEPEGEVSREPFPMAVQHVNGSDVNNDDVNYNNGSTSNMMVQQDASSHVCPPHHHHHDALAAAAGVAPVGYVQQAW